MNNRIGADGQLGAAGNAAGIAAAKDIGIKVTAVCNQRSAGTSCGSAVRATEEVTGEITAVDGNAHIFRRSRCACATETADNTRIRIQAFAGCSDAVLGSDGEGDVLHVAGNAATGDPAEATAGDVPVDIAGDIAAVTTAVEGFGGGCPFIRVIYQAGQIAAGNIDVHIALYRRRNAVATAEHIALEGAGTDGHGNIAFGHAITAAAEQTGTNIDSAAGNVQIRAAIERAGKASAVKTYGTIDGSAGNGDLCAAGDITFFAAAVNIALDVAAGDVQHSSLAH